MARVYIDLKRFLDYRSIRTYPTTEYHIKSLPEKIGIGKDIRALSKVPASGNYRIRFRLSRNLKL